MLQFSNDLLLHPPQRLETGIGLEKRACELQIESVVQHGHVVIHAAKRGWNHKDALMLRTTLSEKLGESPAVPGLQRGTSKNQVRI
jgi:hypothetical protein